MANLPRLTAEAAVYPTAEVYRTDPATRRGIGASVTPATPADRIDAVRDYINRLDFMTLKQKLTLPPSWGRHSWTPEQADAAEAKYKKWLLLQRKHEDVVLSPDPPGGELDIFWHFHILDTEAISATPRGFSAVSGPYLHHPPDFGSMGTPYRNTQGGCSAPNTARS